MIEPSHILVVDQDADTRSLLQETFGGAGYRVSLAASGEEALAYLHLITPDLILFNLLLPDKNGLELTRRLKTDTSKPFIPIIIITERTDLEASVMSLDAGADDFLVKPLAVDELLARVRAMLRLQRAQRGLRNEQRKTELLLHLTRELGASIELDTLLTRFLDHLADAVGAVRASIILLDEAEQTVCYSSSRNPATPLLSDILRQGVAGWVLHERVSLIIDDTRDDPRWIGNASYHFNVRSVAAMPVVREGRVLAVITLVHHTPGYFSEQHIELLSSVAAQSAVALESAQLFSLTQRQKELLERRADELRRINNISALMSELMQPEQLLRLVAYMVHQQFGYPQVHVLMCEGEDLVLHSSAGIMRSELPSLLRFPMSQGITGWAIRHQQITRVDDVQADERFVSLLPDDATIRSEIVLPIVLRSEVLGTLNVQSPIPAAFGPNEEAVLSAIVSQLGIALGNARLLENEQWRIRQLNQVNKLSVAITEQLDAIQNLHLAADSVAQAFGVKQAGLVLLDHEESPEHILVALHGGAMAEDELFIRRHFARADVRTRLHELRAPRIVTDVQNRPALQALHRFFQERDVNALIVVPLLTGTHVMGLIGIDATGWEDRIGNADLELATTIASLIIQVIDNARLYRAVEDERSTLNAVLRGAADPILLIGPEDELLLANRAAEERFHFDLKQNRGKALGQLELNGYGDLVLSELLPLLSVNLNRDTIGKPSELVLPDQETTYSVSVAPVRSTDGQPIGRVAVLQDISAIKALERQERDRVRSVFRRYVSPPVAEQLLSAGQEWGRPTERQVAVLFADLRGFTSMTERLEPNILIEQILNRYFNAMTEVLYEYDGTIDKFLGDGIIGVFGTPISRPDDPQRALRSAIDMQQALARLSTDWCQELGLDIGMGIGISFGRAVVGNIGSEQRLDYTLIGDVVNTASRLSNIARPGQIIVSHNLHSALPPNWNAPRQLRPLGAVPLKGKQDPHLIFEVLY
jgi:adenylate cyclase